MGVVLMFYEWNITKCRAKYKGHKEANYTFWIIDYFREEDIISKISILKENRPLKIQNLDDEFDFLNWHITDMRNMGIVKTKYFRKEKEVNNFIRELNKKGGE